MLVDYVHENMLNALPEKSETVSKRILSHPYLQWLEAVLGYKRLKGPSDEIKRMFAPLPEFVKNSYIAQMCKTTYVKTISEEKAVLAESLNELGRSQVHLQDKPLVVISAGKFSSKTEREAWHSLQKNLLSKSNNSKQIIAEESDHMINHHQPEIIISVIKENSKF